MYNGKIKSNQTRPGRRYVLNFMGSGNIFSKLSGIHCRLRYQ